LANHLSASLVSLVAYFVTTIEILQVMNQTANQHPQTVVYIVQDNKESIGVAAVSGFFVSLLFCFPCSSLGLFICFKKERSRGAILLATALGTLVYIIVLWYLFAVLNCELNDRTGMKDGLCEGLAFFLRLAYGIPAGIYSILFFVFLAFGYRMFRRVDEVDEDSTLPVMK
jgi:hypothetical protein